MSNATLFPLDQVTLTGRLRLRLAIHWLREPAAGSIEGTVGAPADSGVDVPVRATLSGSFIAAATAAEDGRRRIRIFTQSVVGLAVEAERVTEVPATLAAVLPGRLAQVVWEQAFPALEKLCAARWSGVRPGYALFDRTFGSAGESAAAAAGRLDGELAGADTIQVHLPFFDRKEWDERAETLERAEATADGEGHIFVHTGRAFGRERQRTVAQVALAIAAPLLFPEDSPRFDLTFTDRRTTPRAHVGYALSAALRACEMGDEPWKWLGRVAGGDNVEAEVSLSVPGNLAGAWLRVPEETVGAFFEVFSKVSIAIQRVSRRWVPYAYFSELDRYEDWRTAYPLIFYQSTHPYSGRPRSDFAYDLVGPGDPGVARPWAFRPLVSELARIHQTLLNAGRPDLARLYETWRAREIVAGVVRQPKHINALLTNDAFFIDQFVSLGLEARALAARHASDPERAAKELAAFLPRFAVPLHRRLRRLYAGWGFEAFGSLLLVEATRALAGALDGSASVAATVRFAAGGRGRTFLNETARASRGASWPNLPC